MKTSKLCGVLKIAVKKKQAMSVLLSYAQPRMLDLSPGGGYILFKWLLSVLLIVENEDSEYRG